MGLENKGSHETETTIPFSYIFFVLSANMAFIVTPNIRVFHKFEKKSKKLLFF